MGVIILVEHDFSSQEEFEKWKSWSDEDYRNAEKRGRAFYDRVISVDTMNFEDKKIQSAEEILIAQEERIERKNKITGWIKKLKKLLTKKQYRRAWLFYAEERTINEIAELEGVKPQSIEDSLSQVRKKLKKTSKTT